MPVTNNLNIIKKIQITVVIMVVILLLSVYGIVYINVESKSNNEKYTKNPQLNDGIYTRKNPKKYHLINTTEFTPINILNIKSIKKCDYSKFTTYANKETFNIQFVNDLVSYISSVYSRYKIFVVLINKDIIIQTATLVSFMFENLTKPIIFITDVMEGDIIKNLKQVNSIPEVLIGDKKGNFYRANRTLYSPDNDEYISPKSRILNNKSKKISSKSQSQTQYDIKYLDTGISLHVISLPNLISSDIEQINYLLENIHGLIIICDKSSTQQLNSLDKQIIAKLGNATNTVKVAVSINCEEFDIPTYLENIGFINCKDMTVSSAYSKLLFILSNLKSSEEFGLLPELMLYPMKYEITN